MTRNVRSSWGAALLAAAAFAVLISTGCVRDRSTAVTFVQGECPRGTTSQEMTLDDGTRLEWCERPGPDGEPEKHGSFASWHPNGQMAGLGGFVDGREHGPFKLWYENGQMSQEGEFRNGLPHGRWTAWLEDGTRVYIMDFRDGEIVCGEDPLQPACE